MYLDYIHVVVHRLMAANLCQIFFIIIIMVSRAENGPNSLKVCYANK